MHWRTIKTGGAISISGGFYLLAVAQNASRAQPGRGGLRGGQDEQAAVASLLRSFQTRLCTLVRTLVRCDSKNINYGLILVLDVHAKDNRSQCSMLPRATHIVQYRLFWGDSLQ